MSLLRTTSRTFKGRSAGTLGQLNADTPRPRSYGPNNRMAPRLSAACARNDHTSCFSLNCICTQCGHIREARCA